MKIAFFDTRPFEKDAFTRANAEFSHEINFLEPRLVESTAKVAQGYPCVCAFVNAKLNETTLKILKDGGINLLALRCAGFNQVDLAAAKRLGITVVRVPDYSPHAIAEHVVALIQTLNRKTHRAYNRVREGNFSLNGLMGFDLYGKTIGIIGTGKIGKILVQIMTGFGCEVLLNDLNPDEEFAAKSKARYVSLEEIYSKSDIISLHVPLTPATRHFIDATSLSKMKKGVMLINTGRGALIDTAALIEALKSGHVGNAGLDVYEEEEGIFFQDLSGQILSDDTLARLLTFPNVLITSHQGFLTNEAMTNIAETTLKNVSDFEQGLPLRNQVSE
ncbi:MAG: 2-hydroxyacid dehydrogenase [Bacteriovoracaceae bacterium]|nr:2-hydroxyacid dehydrogenase [Bacteriovoracaceae bacterium]